MKARNRRGKGAAEMLRLDCPTLQQRLRRGARRLEPPIHVGPVPRRPPSRPNPHRSRSHGAAPWRPARSAIRRRGSIAAKAHPSATPLNRLDVRLTGPRGEIQPDPISPGSARSQDRPTVRQAPMLCAPTTPIVEDRWRHGPQTKPHRRPDACVER